jgi:DNA-3-methyladenine glycosylase
MSYLDQILTPTLFSLDAVTCARNLLGKMLVRRYQGEIMAGVITETEAYQGEEDLGCHARAGKTRRTAVMYGPPGHAYVYFT